MRLIQIGLAICLMASLLAASPAACVCSHHEEVAASVECHSDHKGEKTDVPDDGSSVEDQCICVSDQRTPSLVSKSESKDLKIKDSAAHVPVISELQFVASYAAARPANFVADELFYLNTLRSLLPARAPPRL